MGCFDTVMALKVSPRIHDISVNTSTCCYRQALALNEERLTFKHEMLRRKQSLAVLGLTEANYSKPQYTDAWFIGSFPYPKST
jgi:collagenase-like PrtC family protease